MSWYWFQEPGRPVWVPPAQPHFIGPLSNHVHFAPTAFHQTGPPAVPPQLLSHPDQANRVPPPQWQSVSYHHPPASVPVYPPQVVQPPRPLTYQYGPPPIAAPPREHLKPSDQFWYVPAGQAPNAGAHGKNVWHGRSREQAQHDHRVIGTRSGYAPHAIGPYKPRSDEVFEVIEPDGGQTWRNVRNIEEMEGEWKQASTGHMFFVRSAYYESDSGEPDEE